MVEPMLNNSEAWINITQENENDLEKPDIMLQRKLLTHCGNPSKVFMCLELGVVPVKFVIMAKRVQFLKTILDESMNSTMRQVYTAQKEDSIKGYFVNLVTKDLSDLEIIKHDETIEKVGKDEWKKIC